MLGCTLRGAQTGATNRNRRVSGSEIHDRGTQRRWRRNALQLFRPTLAWPDCRDVLSQRVAAAGCRPIRHTRSRAVGECVYTAVGACLMMPGQLLSLRRRSAIVFTGVALWSDLAGCTFRGWQQQRSRVWSRLRAAKRNAHFDHRSLSTVMMAPPDLRRTVSPIAKPMGAVPDADQGVWHRQDMFQPFIAPVTIQTDPLPSRWRFL
jgi:hypothetical protein